MKKKPSRRVPLWVTLLLSLALYGLGVALLALGRGGSDRALLFSGLGALLVSGVGMLLALRPRADGAEAPEREPETVGQEPVDSAVPIPSELPEDAVPPDDLLAVGLFSRTTYQLVAGREALHFVQLGVDEDLSPAALARSVMTCGGDDEAIRLQMDKGFAVPWRDVRSVSLRLTIAELKYFTSLGVASIAWAGGSQRLQLVRRDSTRDVPARVAAFFRNAPCGVSVDTTRYDRAAADEKNDETLLRRRAEGRDEALLKKLLPLQWALGIIPLPIALLWRTFPPLFAPLSWVMTALVLLPVVLVAAFPRCFSVDLLLGLRRKGSAPWRKTTDLSIPLGVSGYLLMMAALVDYPICNYAWAAVLVLAVGFAAALWMTRPLRRLGLPRLRLRRALLALVLAVTLSGAVLELNDLLDPHPVEYRQAVVTDKRESTGRCGSYLLYLRGEDAPRSVSRAEYESVEPGNSVILEEHPGAFGIRYSFLWTMQDWYGA